MYSLEEFKRVKKFRKEHPDLMKKVVLKSYDHTSHYNREAYILGFIDGYDKIMNNEVYKQPQ